MLGRGRWCWRFVGRGDDGVGCPAGLKALHVCLQVGDTDAGGTSFTCTSGSRPAEISRSMVRRETPSSSAASLLVISNRLGMADGSDGTRQGSTIGTWRAPDAIGQESNEISIWAGIHTPSVRSWRRYLTTR